ncbi:MAG: lytic transglycosylase domain-containing protein, partial [Tagaea sp.]|nr:lytic transglycosylase domain-containing protein [Tagaea sp.]
DLPRPLSEADVRAYRAAFAAQARGDSAAADAALRHVRDRSLTGHVLAERYLSRSHRSTYEELAAWLRENADHPDAPAIHALAVRRAPPRGAAPLRKPAGESFTERAGMDDLGPGLGRSPPMRTQTPGAAQLRARLAKGISDGQFDRVERELLARETQAQLSAAEIDHYKAQLASGWFMRGDDRKAIALAEAAARRSGASVPRAHWIAGLAEFRQQRYGRAAGHFEGLAKLPGAPAWDQAAGAFWAARAHLHDRKPDVYNFWLAQAAEAPRTFYGLLAARALGIDPGLNWNPPPLTAADIERLKRHPAAARAFALLQVDQDRRAEAEMRRVLGQGGAQHAHAALAVAMRANMPGLAMRLAREINDLDGRRFDGANYPIPHWRPDGGFDVDPALVFAFMRVESAFNPRAISPAGARGLMQLMPATAGTMNGASLRGQLDRLFEPSFNITLGQRYIRALLEDPLVSGELTRLAAAYNGGPGNLSKWKRLQDQRGETREDALLFIESLPAAETRQFITRLLYSYWMYSERLGQSTTSLDQLAQGEWPIYAPPTRAAARASEPPQTAQR